MTTVEDLLKWDENTAPTPEELCRPYSESPEHDELLKAVRLGIDELRAACDAHEVHWEDSYGPGKLILELYEKTTEAELWGPVFVCDYPKEVSPLARDHRSRVCRGIEAERYRAAAPRTARPCPLGRCSPWTDKPRGRAPA